jgi:N,N'-diacetyllegionaminate synthase
LKHIGSLEKQVILSTGMSNLQEVEDALDVLIDAGASKDDITVLHANTMYPTPMEDVNLNAMLTIQKEFGINIGYSDHTLGVEVDVAAVAMGASCIEKHFTLDKTMDGPDHKASLEPEELKNMVRSIRNIEKALGSSEKKPSPSESVNINIVRKSIVANQDIKEGDLLTDENIAVKRPGNGVSPMKWDNVINSIAAKDYNVDDLI